MADLSGQGDFAVRLDWGPTGARATEADVSVVVDVLSFSTSVTVAVERGMRVLPCPWRSARAQEYADEQRAVLARGRLEAAVDGAQRVPSLSPASLLACEPYPRLVLPSPNGSAIAAALLERGARVAAGCLRNARAVAEWLAQVLATGRSVAVIAAGERWSQDDSLRPALEDHLGAGAILSELAALAGHAGLSPEARAAADLFEVGRDGLHQRMRDCVGGRELIGKGYADDVEVAADLDASPVVPVLVDGAFEHRATTPVVS
ncbi:2-phosphosulfolactate phosphatase [Nocardioides sambongensis]|uniref:2-phosphosulfolactate phosphatase n=1 Tax=Nocardioides sambongensis TaxID=2589074 RepID=UPI001E3CCFD0|nr:2-phosphosulfolactate phosphatase [Nocardioides sambongensis]